MSDLQNNMGEINEKIENTFQEICFLLFTSGGTMNKPIKFNFFLHYRSKQQEFFEVRVLFQALWHQLPYQE